MSLLIKEQAKDPTAHSGARPDIVPKDIHLHKAPPWSLGRVLVVPDHVLLTLTHTPSNHLCLQFDKHAINYVNLTAPNACFKLVAKPPPGLKESTANA